VVECTGCGLMRLDPWPEAGELGQYYPEGYWWAEGESAAARLEGWYRRIVLSDHVRFVRRALGRAGGGRVVLDVGCGGGLFARMLREAGWQAIGLDNSEQAAGLAWRGNDVPAVCALLEASPIAPGRCAAVTMFHVLEHVMRPGEYLEQARDMLAPEGRLIVQVPNAACWQFLLLGENWNGLDIPRHLIDFRKKDLEELVARCGFEVVARKQFSLRDNPAGLATSLAPGLDPMARRLRGAAEPAGMKLAKDALYFALVLGSLPFTTIEAACRAGSTIMIEARKR
jgi:SAM-dependent methyltransferase